MAGTLSEGAFHRVVAPAIEEVAKCAFIAYLILKRRIGFPVERHVFKGPLQRNGLRADLSPQLTGNA